ncbi:MAG TPA: hypothetical protein VER79_05940 [Candidatus Limnocylindrales bacterium]|nr:hypothetical protein [Candidatus Limnocylindrales bacterium]
MSEELITQQLARLRALLSEERAGPLTEAEAQPSAEDVGALQAIGYRTKKPDVTVAVYIFPDWSKHREVGAALTKQFNRGDDDYVRTASNGPMLFVAHTRLSSGKGREAEYRLDRILTAFAGDE